MLLRLKEILKSLSIWNRRDGGAPARAHPSLTLELGLLANSADVDPGGTAQDLFERGNDAIRGLDMAGAEKLFREALDIHPRFVDVHCNLGALYRDWGQAELARLHLQKALQLDPGSTIAAFNLAMSFLDEKRWSDALPLLGIAADRIENKAEVQYWMGNALIGIGDHISAQKAYEAAFRLAPTSSRARWGYAMAQLPAIPDDAAAQLQSISNFKRELARLQKWFLKNKNKNTDSELPVGAQQPYYLAYTEGNHKELLSTYGALCSEEMKRHRIRGNLSAEKPRKSKKKLVGIVSAHIFEHSVWRAFVRGWVEHLDRRKVELHIFYVGGVMDAETEWAKKQAAHFHHGLQNWLDWAYEIRNEQLDALVYPEIGMDATTLRLAALRLAPTQMVGWGHPITSGLPTMDAYISANAFEPLGSDAHYSEKLISLKGIGACYRPYKLKIPACDFKQMGLHSDEVLIICAGMPMKYFPKYDPVFIEISKGCEQSKLIFFKKDGDPFFEKFENRLRGAYRSEGLDFDNHVCFVSWLPRPEFFALLQRADIYLDSIGFSGFNTAMQALECDLPIVAFEGDAMRGRFASGLLRTIGLQEWVASNPAEFVGMVGRLAQDPASRQAYKRKIASHKSQLMNGASSVDELYEIISQ